MFTYELSKDFEKINRNEYLEVYKKQSSVHQDYYHHPQFQYTCYSTFSNYENCYLFSAFRNDKLIGYQALKECTVKLKGISYHMLVPLGYRVSEYNYPVVDYKFIDDFLKVFYQALKRENLFFPNTPSFFSRRLLNSFKKLFIYGYSENPILRNIENEFLNAATKKGIVRDFKQLSNKYGLLFEHKIEGIESEDLNEFFQMHIERWSKVGIKSKFTNEKFRNVYEELIKVKVNNIGSPILNTMKADGMYIAMHYGFLSKNRFIYQIPVYNINFNTNKSPGSILLKSIFEFNVQEKIEIFDMGTGLESYKYRFMNDIEIYSNLVYFKGSAVRFLNRLNLK